MEKDNPDVLASTVSVQCPGLSKLLMTVLLLCAAVCCQELALWLELLVPPAEDNWTTAAPGLGTMLFLGVPQCAGGAEPEVEGQEAKGGTSLGTRHTSPPRCWLGAFYLQPFHCNLFGKEMLLLKRGGRWSTQNNHMVLCL